MNHEDLVWSFWWTTIDAANRVERPCRVHRAGIPEELRRRASAIWQGDLKITLKSSVDFPVWMVVAEQVAERNYFLQGSYEIDGVEGIQLSLLQTGREPDSDPTGWKTFEANARELVPGVRIERLRRRARRESRLEQPILWSISDYEGRMLQGELVHLAFAAEFFLNQGLTLPRTQSP